MDLFKREKYLERIRPFYDSDDLIKVITGIRRCGKSCLMQIISQELKERDIPEENIIFLDLDLRKYRKIDNADSLESLIEEKSRSAKSGMIYLFIDEIQNVAGFEEVINGFRSESGYSIFITGSNSYLLSGELVTKLTGRYLEFEMFTLSFDEYVQMKEYFGMAVNPNLAVELNSYILEGGFPRTVLIDEKEAKRAYVSGVVNEIFEKDIKRRNRIKDTAAFESVRNYCINNFGAVMSISSICDALRSDGASLTRATVSRYIQVLTDAKVLYECKRFDLKSKRSLKNEKKYYLADLGLYFATNTDNRINYGPNLENIVYIYAKSMNYSVSIGRIGKLECDFILRGGDQDYAYVQVSYTIAPSRETEEREYRPLEQIRDNYPKYLMTTDYILQKRNGIKHVNIMDFMIQNKRFGD